MPNLIDALRTRAVRSALRIRDRVTWRVTKEFGWVLAGQAVALVGSVALTKVLASRLGTEQYGRFALGMTVAVFLNQFLFGPITLSAIRYFSSYRDSGRLEAFVQAVARLLFSATALVVVALIPVVAFVFRRYGADWAALIALASVFGVFQNVFGLFNGLDAAARDRSRVALHQAADPALRLALAAASLWVVSRSALAAMLGVTIATSILMASQVMFFQRALHRNRRVGERSPDILPDTGTAPAAGRALLSYSKYFVLAGIFTSLQLSSDRWALKLYLDDAAVGVYAAAFQLASAPGIVLAGCLSQFFSPIVFQRAGDGSSLAALRHARGAILVGTAVLSVLVAASSVIAALTGEPLMVLFTSPAYRSSGPYLAPLVLGVGLLQIGHMLGLQALSSNRLKGHLAVKIVHGSLAAALNVFAVRHFGIAGLCGASIVGGTVYVILVLLNNARITRSFAVPPMTHLQVSQPFP